MVCGMPPPRALFQSTLPAWGATSTSLALVESPQNFNPRSPHGERHITISDNPPWGRISIHAPRMGSDLTTTVKSLMCKNFNPRSPHGERHGDSHVRGDIVEFQSTLPAWGATIQLYRYQPGLYISIHAPRMGSDSLSLAKRISSTVFQSTLPAWGATYPLNPASSQAIFQSTLPAWGATDKRWKHRRGVCISIHAPRMGSDPPAWTMISFRATFQSTLPAWGATAALQIFFGHFIISIHAPRMGSDVSVIQKCAIFVLFQSTLPAWGATLSSPILAYV